VTGEADGTLASAREWCIVGLSDTGALLDSCPDGVSVTPNSTIQSHEVSKAQRQGMEHYVSMTWSRERSLGRVNSGRSWNVWVIECEGGLLMKTYD
jgi:hypothetical protein